MTPRHPAFETLSERDLPEYRARGVLLRHRKTGCEVYRLAADDPENVFAFAFRTRPRDATGVAHIVEHSVLCGSERFPVKDPFLSMARRSLATFMNAFTYPDKTVYPAASAVEADYFNLMDVYGDAVFFPRLAADTFLQEAHRLEIDAAGRLSVKGVVYNEMRGDYSSSESLAATACYTSLFSRGHPYSFDSGGDPARITSLSYATFKCFWADHYHPSNCRIFLYGNIDTVRQLDFLEERFLSRFWPRPANSDIPLQSLAGPPRRVSVPYPLAEGSDAATSVVVNWLTAPSTDGMEALAMEVLSELLLGHDGAFLAKALRDSDLGEDLSPQCGLDTGFRQMVFSAGLRGAERGREAEIEDLIVDTVADIASRGFPPDALDAALHSIAFANREIRRGAGAYGFRLFNRAIRGWLHGAAPEATLSFESAMAALRARLSEDRRYLESLAESYIIGNDRRSTVTVYPDAGLLERMREESSARLEREAAALTPARRAEILAESARLAAAQEAPDPPEEVAKLPGLSIADLPRAVERIEREAGAVAGLPALFHPLFTNGIVYLDLAFPLDEAPREIFPWLPLLSRFVAGAGLPGQPYYEVAKLLARRAGGFGAVLDSATPAGPGLRGSSAGSYAVFRLKALGGKFSQALELALGLLAGADYRDRSRAADLYAELRNDVVSALVPSGNAFASTRAASAFGEAGSIDELWRGTSQLRFLVGLREGEGERATETLEAAAAAVFSRRGLIVHLTAEPSALGPSVAALESALDELPAAPRRFPAALATRLGPPAPPLRSAEAYSISSQVGFAASVIPSRRLGEAGFGLQTVLAHLLTTGPLWEEIRVRGGAYGASCHVDGLESTMSFSTYRDPHPCRSFSVFRDSLLQVAAGTRSSQVEEAALGVSGRDLKPMLPEEKGFVDFKRSLFGITDQLRQAKRDEILAADSRSLAREAGNLASAWGGAASVLISHADDVRMFAGERPDAVVAELPT